MGAEQRNDQADLAALERLVERAEGKRASDAAGSTGLADDYPISAWLSVAECAEYERLYEHLYGPPVSWKWPS